MVMKLPNAFAPNIAAIDNLKRELKADAGELARALPDSKGGETPKQLQTYRLDVRSVFTQPSLESQELYAAEQWVRIKINLQTGGPVAVGTAESIAPVLSGKGILLDPDKTFEAYIPKGGRFYCASETVNRLDLIIEPVPWLEQMDLDMIQTQQTIALTVKAIGKDIVDALAALQAKRPIKDALGPVAPITAPTGAPGARPDGLPSNFRPPPVTAGVPRLTAGILPPKLRR